MRKRFLIILAASLLILVLSAFNLTRRLKVDKGREDDLSLSCTTQDLTGAIDFSKKVAIFEGQRVNLPQLAFGDTAPQVLGVAADERWIEVDLSEQKLRAWEGDNLFLETLVSTGLPWYPTPEGEFRIWIKLRATKMEGGTGRNYYYLPNVPYVMYFQNSQIPGWRGYGLHGTYWHNDFGRQKSHGCVNLPTPIAEKLYYWTDPVLSSGKNVVRSDNQNLGTRIVIHQ